MILNDFWSNIPLNYFASLPDWPDSFSQKKKLCLSFLHILSPILDILPFSLFVILPLFISLGHSALSLNHFSLSSLSLYHYSNFYFSRSFHFLLIILSSPLSLSVILLNFLSVGHPFLSLDHSSFSSLSLSVTLPVFRSLCHSSLSLDHPFLFHSLLFFLFLSVIFLFSLLDIFSSLSSIFFLTFFRPFSLYYFFCLPLSLSVISSLSLFLSHYLFSLSIGLSLHCYPSTSHSLLPPHMSLFALSFSWIN